MPLRRPIQCSSQPALHSLHNLIGRVFIVLRRHPSNVPVAMMSLGFRLRVVR
jgi:hypothetical protein